MQRDSREMCIRDRYYTKAAEFGDDLAKSNLADIYRKGTNGVIKDMKKAFELYQSCHLSLIHI